MQAQVTGQVVQYALENPAQTAQWGANYAKGLVQGLQGLFQGAFDIRDRNRSLQLTFVNATNRELMITQNFFDSGTWYNSFPPVIPPQTVVVGGVANSQGSILTGVAGGLGLSIGGSNVNVSIGFTNPQVGSYKYSANLRYENDGNGEYGYNNAFDNNPKYSQLDGFTLQAQQVSSDFAQMGYLWTLNEGQ